MIACKSQLIGTVVSIPREYRNSSGEKYYQFSLSVGLRAKTLDMINHEISVYTRNPDIIKGVKVGDRCNVEGELTIRKRNGEDLLGLRLEKRNELFTDKGDSLKGVMENDITLGKDIQEHKDRKGNPFLTFSGYSYDKTDNGYEYIWIRHVLFGRNMEAWLQPKTKVRVKGEIEVTYYNGRPTYSCVVSEINPR